MENNAVIYARFSSDNQREESIDAQIRLITEYADSNGYKIIKTYVDRAKSAKTDNRPEFQNMIKDSATGIFSTVIVHKLDRFSRDRYDSANYKRKLRRNGTRVVSVLENLDDSPESIILESMLEGMAEYYSANLAREVMKGMTQNALQAKQTGGKPPLGFAVAEDKTYILNEQEAPIIKLIYKKYLDGYTYTEILNELSRLGYKTQRGTAFSKGGINKILSNEKYCGTYIFNQYANKNAQGKRNSSVKKKVEDIIRIEGGMPVVISKEDFEAVNKRMMENKRTRGTKKAKTSYLLSGIIRCGECGYAMHGNKRPSGNDGIYISYRCGGRKSKRICTNTEIRRDLIEEYILSELETRLLSKDVISGIVKYVNTKLLLEGEQDGDRLQDMQSKLKQVEEEINNIVQAVIAGLNSATLTTKIHELETAKSNLELEIAITESKDQEEMATKITEEQVEVMIADIKQYVTERNLPQCKRLIKGFVKERL